MSHCQRFQARDSAEAQQYDVDQGIDAVCDEFEGGDRWPFTKPADAAENVGQAEKRGENPADRLEVHFHENWGVRAAVDGVDWESLIQWSSSSTATVKRWSFWMKLEQFITNSTIDSKRSESVSSPLQRWSYSCFLICRHLKQINDDFEFSAKQLKRVLQNHMWMLGI